MLVAEDNDVNRMVVVAVLQSLGLPYRVAHDGQEALEAFMDRPPALILMDSQMPRLSGGDCTRSIRAIEAERELQRTPIIALTANASAADREACMVAGMDDFLAKPFALTDLRAHVLRWVRPTGADHGRAVAAPATPGE